MVNVFRTTKKHTEFHIDISWYWSKVWTCKLCLFKYNFFSWTNLQYIFIFLYSVYQTSPHPFFWNVFLSTCDWIIFNQTLIKQHFKTKEKWTGLVHTIKNIKIFHIYLKTDISKNFLCFYNEIEIFKKVLYSLKT